MAVERQALRDWHRLFGLLLTDLFTDELIGFGQAAYRRRSAETSLLLGQLFERFRQEGLAMAYTMEDFKRDYMKEHLAKLTPEEQEEVLQALPPERRLAGLTEKQIREYLDRLSAKRPTAPRKPRRKK